jgi:hypothetical protein
MGGQYLTLIFNLPGAIQELQIGRTNKEKIESIYRLTEEFYKTLSILLLARYRSLENQNNVSLPELTVLIEKYLKEPTFDSWIRLANLLKQKLLTENDRFAKDLDQKIKYNIKAEDLPQAKNILKEIHTLRSSTINLPHKITLEDFLSYIRLLRNFRSHEWDTNQALEPIINLSIDEFVIDLIERVFQDIEINIIKPLAREEKYIEIVEIYGSKKKINRIPIDNKEVKLGQIYISFYTDEDYFQFQTNLIKFDEKTNRIFTYLHYKKNSLYESIPITGEIQKQKFEGNFEEIFELDNYLLNTNKKIPLNYDSIKGKRNNYLNTQNSITHLTARMVWHDNNWEGRICNNPDKNFYCGGERSLLGDRIARNKNLDIEVANSGKKIEELEGYIPPCFWSINAFNNESQNIIHQHPFSLYSNKKIKEELNRFSIFTWPFRLSFVHDNNKKKIHGKYPHDLEKRIRNFQEKFTKNESLIFFYLNFDNPIAPEEKKYLVIGCSLITDIKQPYSFEFSPDELTGIRRRPSMQNFPTINWAFQVSYDFKENGILLPYKEYLESLKNNQEVEEYFNEIKVLIEEEHIIPNFKYVAADIDSDICIYLLYKLKKSISIINEQGITSCEKEGYIIEHLLEKAWHHRGLYPSLSKIIKIITEDEYFGNNLISRIASNLVHGENLLDKIFEVLFGIAEIPVYLYDFKDKIKFIRIHRRTLSRKKELLKKLSLFSLSESQIKRIVNLPTAFRSSVKEEQIISNPYILCEEYISQHSVNTETEIDDYPISQFKIDIGMFPDTKYIDPDLKYQDLAADDQRRLRSLIIEYLRKVGKNDGHCYVNITNIDKEIKSHPLFYKKENGFESELTDLMINDKSYYDHFSERLELVDSKYFYLKEVFAAERFIENTIHNLLERKDYRHEINNLEEYVKNEQLVLEKRISNFDKEQFFHERNKLLKQVLKKSLFVISGKPGAGKTHVLTKIIEEIKEMGENLIVLAPTGKASLRITKLTGQNAETIDRFIFRNNFQDYLNDLQSLLKKQINKKLHIQNLIIDECSMVDLQRLSTLFSMIETNTDNGIKRIILVGDENQLPPIGYGRPFFDIINYIKSVPKLNDENYVELITNCRQGYDKKILELAESFVSKNKYYSQILDELSKDGQVSTGMTIESWNDEPQLNSKIDNSINNLIETHPDQNLLRNIDKEYEIMNFIFGLTKDGHVRNDDVNSLQLDYFQIITPYRGGFYGTIGVNEYIKHKYKKKNLKQLVNGTTFVHSDKIIRTENWYEKNSFGKSDKTLKLSNGSIGTVSVKDRQIKYYFPDYLSNGIFNGFEIDSTENFELAYAITVHKSQGSEFDNVFIVIPNKRSLLTKELIYTALTRSTKKITIFLQKINNGNLLKDAIQRSANLSRNTSLFEDPLDYQNKIQPSKGVFVKSKIEFILFNIFESEGLNFEYERSLSLKENKTIHPDFTITIDNSTFYLEHLGRLDIKTYSEKWQKRLELYKKNNIYQQLITTDDINGLSKEKIIEVILELKNKTLRDTPFSKFSSHHYQLY